MPILLYKHNEKAYESALRMLNLVGKAAVIHPTGSGKSLIGFKLAEEHPQARICWLAPSRYIFEQQKENLQKTAPDCGLDNITFLTYARLMANRDRVSHLKPDFIILDEFHRCGAAEWGKGVGALLACFPRAKVLGFSATSIRYLDEQRDMAAELFGGQVASEITLGEAIARGILASPRYVISVYRYEKELEKYNERICLLKDGPRKAQAARQLQKLRRALSQADGLEVLFKRYLKADGKYIVFCSGLAHLREMEERAGEWFAPVDAGYRIYRVFSENPQSAAEFEAFKEDKSDSLRLLFCIDMLNEGIHLGDVDGVILMRPTVSPVIYKQQIGRALTVRQRAAGQEPEKEAPGEKGADAAAAEEAADRRDAGKKEESPLILDIVNNFENLHSIDSIEMEYEQTWWKIAGVTDEMREEGVSAEQSAGAFRIIDETHNARKLFERLQDQLSAGWDAYYEEAKRYRLEYGNLEVPAKFVAPSGLSLGSWLLTQRRIYMGKIPGRLEDKQIEKLNELGICWESYSDRQWDRYYEKAAAYYAENGDLNVNGSYVTADGFRLGIWLNNIRQYRQNGSRILSGQRLRQLERIGMIWDKLTYKWERGYEAAEQYYNAHRNLEVPAGYVTADGFRLGSWITAQRQNRKGGNKGALPLTEGQVARLDRIGMSWDGKQADRWEMYFAAAKEYAREKGSLEVPYDYVTEEGVALGRWIGQQRAVLRTAKPAGERAYEGARAVCGTGSGGGCDGCGSGVGRDENAAQKTVQKAAGRKERERERIRRLTEIGMVWSSDPWKEKWELARQYYETHGNLRIPQGYVTENGVWLGKWLYLQRELYRKGELEDWQVRELEAVGMDWLLPVERAWEEAFQKAKGYFEGHGHLKVEKGYATEDGFRLDLWLKRQRKAYREGNGKVLTGERIARLEELGMRW